MKQVATGLLATVAVCDTVAAEGPMSIDMSHISEIWTNVDGGLQKGTEYLAYADLGVDIDGDRAFGWSGVRSRISAIYSNGRGLGALTGTSQPLSNIETNVSSVWLYEAWFEKAFGKHMSLRVGLQEINEEFDTSDSRGLFLHSSHGVGGAFGSGGVNGPSTYPYTGLGVRFRYQSQHHYYLNAGLFDGEPGDSAFPRKTAIKLGDGEGALGVVEAGYEHNGYKLSTGYWEYTAAHESIRQSLTDGAGLKRKGNNGFYGLVEAPLYVEEYPQQGLVGFIRAGRADDEFNIISSYLSMGGVYTGFFSGRDEDKLGFSLILSGAGHAYRQQLALYGANPDKYEAVVELTYKMMLGQAVYLQPDIQIVFNPGMQPDVENAHVLGLRLGIEW